MNLNENTKTRLIAAGAAVAFAGAATTTVMPYAGGVLAGLAIAGALLGIGVLETKKRAY